MSAYIIEYNDDIPITDLRQPRILDPMIGAGKLKHREAFIPDAMGEHDRIIGMVRENTVWDVYNNEARKVDNELVKDWQSSLNFLLVFAAIFAAVLTAFIIESKKMLEQDQTALLVNVTIWSINNVGNISSLPYTPPDFEPTSAAISINCFLFASLGASLVAALASVVALQWVADYDAAITRGGSSPEDRAKRRQFRFAGVEWCRMGEIIASLPLILYSSVILFWVGAIQWMWILHHIVGYVVAGGTAIAVLFYASTTLLAALCVSAPFRTPISRGIFWMLQPFIRPIGSLLSYVPIARLLRWLQWITKTAFFPILFLNNSSNSSRLPPSVNRPTQWLKTYLLPNTTSRLREDKAAKDDPTLEQQALIWLAYQLPVSADSHYRLSLLLAEVGNDPRYRSSTSSSSEDPWMPILERFSIDCLRRIIAPKVGEGRYEDVGVLLHFIERLVIEGRIRPRSDYEMDHTTWEYWEQHCFTPDSIAKVPVDFSQSAVFLLSRDVPIPCIDSTEELATTARLIRWRNVVEDSKEYRRGGVWMVIFANPKPYSQNYIESCRQIFSKYLSYLGRRVPQIYHLSFSCEPDARCNQLITMIKVATSLMEKYNSARLHSFLIYTICEQMMHPHEDPFLSKYQALLTQQVATIKDPCLSIIVSYACGTPIPGEILVAKSYKSRYFQSLEWIQDLLYHNISLNDSVVAWQSRGIVFGIRGRKEIQLFQDALRYPVVLSYLQLIVQNSTHCHGHSHGIHHVLFHLYQNAGQIFYYSHMTILDSLDVGGVFLNPVLVLLAGSDTDHSSNTLYGRHTSTECATVLHRICSTVKQQPASICALLLDIAMAESENPWDATLVLECVEQALSLPKNEGSTQLLRPLAQAVGILGRRKYTLPLSPPELRDWPAEIVSTNSKRISRLLYTTSISKIVSSSTHLRMLSCARASTTTQPAIGRLPLYVDI